jgi:starch synthase
MMPGYYSTRRHAAGILVASRTTLGQVPRNYRAKSVYIPENAIEPGRFSARRTRTAKLPLRVVFVGRLVPCKAIDLFIEAAGPLIRDGKVHFEIVGDGVEMPLLRDQVKRLAEADLFAFPSIRDFGGGAVLEAMGVGLTPMVINYGGPVELVNAQSAIIIPLGSPDAVVNRMRAELEGLVANPSQLDKKGAAALHRAHSIYTWDYKAKRVLEVYRWLLDGQTSKPTFETDEAAA